MSMLQSTLKDEYVAMDLYGDEADAIAAWTAAWFTYFADAETNGIPIQAAALPAAESALASALIGMSGSGSGAAKIQAGILAWWNALLKQLPSVSWPGCILITPPPGLTGVAAALQSVFDANTSGSVSEEDAYDALAGVLHPANLGGTATFPGPLVFPIL